MTETKNSVCPSLRDPWTLTTLFVALGVLIAAESWSSEAIMSKREDSSLTFNFGVPESFPYGLDEQKQTLLGIAESEFSLAHLSEHDRDLVHEALGRSGVEVHGGCKIEMEVAGSIGAFFVRRKHRERTRFDPDLGVFEIPSEKKKRTESAAWKKVAGDYTEYPYPFGDARLMPKVIPVNLSSVRIVDRDATHMKFDAKPSALLFLKMRPEDHILNADQLRVAFDVDRASRRVSRLTLYLPESVRVYRGIKITNLKFEYVFEDDRTVGRNVLRRVEHMMKGRIGGVFRPNFTFTTELRYDDCSGSFGERSYLLAAIESIRELE